MKYVDIRDLPPCSFSPECLRLIDDLDVPTAARAPARLSHIEDFQDRRRLRQLRSHVPGCPTCSALLAKTRQIRSQQRLALHHFLIANEKHVPSTTGAIFAAIQREQALVAPDAMQEVGSGYSLMDVWDEQRVTPAPMQTRRFFQRTRVFQNVLTVATIAAVILAAVGLFNRVTNHSSLGQKSEPSPQQPAHSGNELNTGGWDSVVIGLTLLSATGFTVYNFNVTSSQMTVLFEASQGQSMLNMEEVSSDGQSVLYDVSLPDRQRAYQTFSLADRVQTVYSQADDQAGNALWMDQEHVLVQNMPDSISDIDLQNQSILQWKVAAGHLVFYRQPFLYFTGAQQSDANVLYRIDLAQQDARPQPVTIATPETRFWLSPDGATIYYASEASTAQAGIYAVGSDGSHLRLLRAGAGLPIGFAPDNSLMVLQQVGSHLEIIKLGVTPEQKEQVILANAAPNATSLCGPGAVSLVIPVCDEAVTLEPSGQGLLLHAYYANGAQNLVYDDLAAGASRVIMSLAQDASVQLPGWSRISSAKAA